MLLKSLHLFELMNLPLCPLILCLLYHLHFLLFFFTSCSFSFLKDSSSELWCLSLQSLWKQVFFDLHLFWNDLPSNNCKVFFSLSLAQISLEVQNSYISDICRGGAFLCKFHTVRLEECDFPSVPIWFPFCRLWCPRLFSALCDN